MKIKGAADVNGPAARGAHTHRSAVQGPAPCHLFAPVVLAFLSPAMLDAESGRGLGRLVAPRDLAPLPSAVARAEVGTADGGLVASVLLATFAAPVAACGFPDWLRSGMREGRFASEETGISRFAHDDRTI